nr:CoA ester lyase [Actinoalloteichus spitiensis]
MDRVRPRRTCLAVPASNPRMIEKARGLGVDEFFLDLEDACAPLAKPAARRAVVEALNAGGWEGRTRVVRVNGVDTEWAYRDVVEVVEGAGEQLDCLLLPKVESVDHVRWLDLTLTQIERALGLPVGRIGIEAQIESASGVAAAEVVATSSPRLEALVFGPADFMASLTMRGMVVGEQPPGYDVGDAFHYVLMRLLVAARAAGIQAIDGPYLRVRDRDGLRRVAGRSAALGFDGKWVLHPDQIDEVNSVFSPARADYEHAEDILDAYAWHTSSAGGARGAAMLGSEMIDEASRKMALVVAARGRAAGLRRTRRWTPPVD